MHNYDYREENSDYPPTPLRKNYSNINENIMDIYNRDRRFYPVTNYKNIESSISSLKMPQKLYSPIESNTSNILTKSYRFQNENLTIYRVSPYHYQYISRIKDDYNENKNDYNANRNYYANNNNYQVDKNNGDQSFNFEREREYNQFLNSRTLNRHQNFLERHDEYNKSNIINRKSSEIKPYNRINNNYINEYNFKRNYDRNKKYQTPNQYLFRENNRTRNILNNSNYYQLKGRYPEENNNLYNNNDIQNEQQILKRNYDNISSRQEKGRYMLRRNNSDMNFSYNNNRLLENERYLDKKEPIYDFDKTQEEKLIFRRKKYYNPNNNDYKRSRYGDYTYNYYLNSPMRGDISEDWRFPPVYNFSHNKNINQNLNSSSNFYKEKFFNNII